MKSEEGQVKPYANDAGSKKEQVERMFDNIAPHYDLLNRVLSVGIDRKWRKQAIALLPERTDSVLLDIATGTGDVAFAIARRYPEAEIIGLDLANNMLDVARRKSAKAGLADRIRFVQGDCENLPFESNSIDGITVAFGVRNFGDLDKGLSEMHRVLRNGGKLVVLEFTRPRRFPFKQLFGIYFRHILPRIGGITSGDANAYRYLYESVQEFPDYDAFIDRMERAGFRDADYKALTSGICAIYTGNK